MRLMSEQPIAILVFSEDRDTMLELLAKSREKADETHSESSVAVLGEITEDEARELGSCGADRAYLMESQDLAVFNVEIYCNVLSQLISEVKPEVILVGGTRRGRELAPRLAERLGIGCVSECVDFEIEGKERVVKMQRIVYGGLALTTYTFNRKPALATISPSLFQKKTVKGREVKIVKVQAKLGTSKLSVAELRPKERSSRKLEAARVVVDAGRGVKKREDLKLLEELAEVLGGQVACSRPLAADKGWFSDWIGISGKKIRSDLCVTIGVSGSIQHKGGIRDSKAILAIDSNPDAPIFSMADYGVVGDLYEVVPALIQALKKRL